MSDIGQLVVRIAADASSLTKELDKIGQKGEISAKQIQKAGTVMAAAFLATASAIVYMTIQAGKQAEEIEQLSTITGIATDTLQGYQVLLARTGLTNQDLSMGFKTLATNIREATNESSGAAKAFYALGLSIKGNEDPAEVLKLIADRLDAMPDGFTKSALATDLFGRAGQSMLKAFKGGSAALDEAARKAEEFGLVLNKTALASLTKMDDAVDDMGSALKGFGMQVGVLFAPVVETTVSTLTDLITKLTGVVKGFNESKTAAEGFARAMIELNKATGSTSARAPEGGKPKGPLAVPPISEEMLDALDEYKKKIISPASIQEKMGKDIVETTPKAIALVKQLGVSWEIAMDLARGKTLAQLEAIVAQGRAQQELGKFLVAQTQEQRADASAAAGVTAPSSEAMKGLLIVERTKAALQAQVDIEKQEAAELLRRLELSEELGITIEEQLKQEQLGAKIVAESAAAHAKRFLVLEDEAKEAQINLDMQKELFQQESVFSDRVEQARRMAMNKIDADERLLRQKAHEDIIGDETRLQAELARIRGQAETRRMAVAREFPTFWEKQLDDLQASNVFSMAQMVSTWSNSIATMIVKGGDLKAAVDATMIAVVQAFINMAVAGVASAVKASLAHEVAATSVTTVWAAAGTALAGIWATITGAFTAMASTLVTIMTAVGEAMMGVLTAIANALYDTIFGSPWAIAILAGVVGIGIALAALGAIPLAEGGIVTGPTLAMVGEAGPEAVIPLNQAGSYLGSGEGRTIQNNIYLDKRRIATVITKEQPRAMRGLGVPA